MSISKQSYNLPITLLVGQQPIEIDLPEYRFFLQYFKSRARISVVPHLKRGFNWNILYLWNFPLLVFISQDSRITNKNGEYKANRKRAATPALRVAYLNSWKLKLKLEKEFSFETKFKVLKLCWNWATLSPKSYSWENNQ
jgi:hypothetical protein